MVQDQIVVDQSDITAGMQKDFWEKVGLGVIHGGNFGYFLEHPNLFSSPSTSLKRALKILGAERIVTAKQSSKAWNIPMPEKAIIGYREEDLREAAIANQSGAASFYLVWCNGFSLKDQRERRGVDKNRSPHFYNNDWWLKDEQKTWASQVANPGYHLLDFGPNDRGRFGSVTWENQEKNIAELDQNLERVHETIVSEAVFSIFMVHKKRLMGEWYHWGKSLTAGRDRVCVGNADSDGWNVRNNDPDWNDNDNLRVVLLWKFPVRS